MRIGVTMGDASGVGPEIALKAAAAGRMPAGAILYGDLAVLERCNERLGLGARLAAEGERGNGSRGALAVRDFGLLSVEDLRIGEVSKPSGEAAFRYVEQATRDALAGRINAIVTLPMNKEATRLTHPEFTGHTELIAGICGAADFALMLASPELLAAHVSTHVSLRGAIDALSAERIYRVVVLTDGAARALERPRRIAVMGLNPHAGEGGAFGSEEIELIVPAVERARADGIEAEGPLPPDTVFPKALAGDYGAVVCMYHDQGHIPMKTLGFERTVNVTVGLPIVRTSVDHGTAFDIAWQGVADIGSFVHALHLAERLAEART